MHTTRRCTVLYCTTLQVPTYFKGAATGTKQGACDHSNPLTLRILSPPSPPSPSLHLLPLSLSLSHPHECLCACVRHIHKRTPHRTALTRSEPALHCAALHCTALNRKTATAPYSRHRRNAVVYLRKEGGCPAAALFVPRLRQCPGFQARVVRSFCIALWTRREAAEGDDLGGEDWAAEP